MTRLHYYNSILQMLAAHAQAVEISGKLNNLDRHQHSENFYLFLLNKLFGWKLVNLNTSLQNVEAIDLVDVDNKIVVQVSSTTTKAKVESALSKDLTAYAGYSFKFMSISKDAGKLRNQTFKNPHALKFVPKTDIYDNASLLSTIQSLEIGLFREIYSLIKDELRPDNNGERVETNLASVIDILAKEDWQKQVSTFQTKPFDVENKITFNNLKTSRRIIDAYNIHYGRVDKIYSEFDKQGANKSHSVLAAIQREYLEGCGGLSDDALFFEVIDRVLSRVTNSSNYAEIPFEELEMCVSILVVDAFIRCKVFENPQGK